MCYHPMKIKAVSACAPTFAFVPCGKCDECRRLLKTGWSFRLGLELQDKIAKGWHVGFCTLTYNDWHVPTIPRDCFLNPAQEYERIMCFDKYEVMHFIRVLRSNLANRFGVTGIVYFIGSEYGEHNTQRPHYHMLVSYPPDKISDKELHALISNFWTDKGFVYPENYDGTGRGYHYDEEQKPFKVDTSIGAYLCAKYASKYACKDIGFEKKINSNLFVSRSNQGKKFLKKDCYGNQVYEDGIPACETAYKRFLRCKPFHLQSRSLGWSYFENMTDSEKLKVMEKGVKFLSEPHRQKLPRYIRNKLIFKNRYDFKIEPDGEKKRLVRREPNEFFDRNVERIYQMKVNGYKTLFESIREESYWTSRGSDKWHCVECNKAMTYLLGKYHLTMEDFTRCYVSLFKVPKDRCYDEVELCRQWYYRYFDDSFPYSDDGVVSTTYDEEFKDDVDSVFSYIFFCLGDLSTQDSGITKKVDKYKQRKKQYVLCD